MSDPIALIAALGDSNVRAFLRMLRHGEGTSDEAGYRRMFGGELFASFADHPRKAITKPLGGQPITSTAAGAYQFLSRTWDGLVKQYGFADFSPKNQDLGAVALIAGRKALDDVIAGRFETAVGKCAREWASLPGSPYGQPVVSMAKAREIYEQHGGTYAPVVAFKPAAPPAPEPVAAAPAAEPVPAALAAPVRPIPAEESVMSPFIAAALPAVLEVVPKLASIFSSGSQTAERNTKAVETVVQVAKDAIGAANEQELVERLQNDPAAATAVRDAVEKNWFEIHQATEKSRAAAREFATTYAAQKDVRTVLGNLTFQELLTLLFILISAIGAGIVLTQDGYSAEIKGSIITLMLIAGYTGVREFWFGSSPVEQAKAKQAG